MSIKGKPPEPEAPKPGTSGNRSRPPSGKNNPPAPQYGTIVAANRKTGGPKTALGRKRSSRNATKFGIFSSATLIEGESRADFESLLRKLWKSKPPGNGFEEILLDKIASNLWRQRRLHVAEAAEIRSSSEFVEFDHWEKELEDTEETCRKRPATVVSTRVSQPRGLIWSIANSHVLYRCIEILRGLREGIESSGFDEKRDSWLLESIYGPRYEAHALRTVQDTYWDILLTSRMAEEERARKSYLTPPQCIRYALQVIDAEIARLEQDGDERESIKSERRGIEVLRQRVPDSPEFDRLLRYATTLNRDLDRTLARYEREQRIRKGQPLPPQLDVKIS